MKLHRGDKSMIIVGLAIEEPEYPGSLCHVHYGEERSTV